MMEPAIPEPTVESGPQVIVALRAGAAAADLESSVRSLVTPAERWLRSAAGLGHPGEHVGVLQYRDATDATVEQAGWDLAALGDAVSLPESICLVGRELTFIEGRTDRVRLWYFMRRRDDYDHERYLERYRLVHSRFGLETPGIDAYTQFHVDTDRSQELASQLGCGVCDFDSVSILDMDSLDEFISEIARSEVGEEAIRDEERFVDRAGSWDYITRRIAMEP